MSDRIYEQLSAFADDELPAGEAPLLWRRMAAEPTLRARWGRYHLYGDALRDGLPLELDHGFAARVAATLTNEPVPAPSVRNPWPRRMGGLAVAASVMVAALVTLRVDEPVAPANELVVTPVTANPQARGASFASTQGLQWERARPEVQQELNDYLLTHGDAAVDLAEEPAR
ncbi:MAG: sigma-E factor negative regulatory protein [Gammaproteobacteria bacterium]